MKTKAEVLAKVQATGLVPVLRADSVEQGFALAEAILAGGIDVMEVTMTVPGAVELIRQLVKAHPEMLIGAGTVLNAEMAAECLDAGAEFIVSPAFDEGTVALCKARGVVVLPGALTPTEVLRAWNAGADVIKVFPASAMGGASYLKSLRAPLPQVKVIPTGGVSLATAEAFLDAGAIALGIGADLVDTKAIVNGEPERVTEQARKYVAIVQAWRAKNG